VDEAASNVARFVSELQQTGGGASDEPQRRQDLDRRFGGRSSRGFELSKRGNVYEVLVQDSDLSSGRR
jgi:hypothetical protein